VRFMWARKCGVPPQWPSRVKVGLNAVFTGAIGYTVYQFMSGGDVGYVDMSYATSDGVICLNVWPQRANIISEPTAYFYEEAWSSFSQMANTSEFISAFQCPFAASINETCDTVTVPLRVMQRDLAQPVGDNVGVSNDIMYFYAHAFLGLGIGLWLSVTTHDIALLHATLKNRVLDLNGVRDDFPWIVRFFKLSGFSFLNRLRKMACDPDEHRIQPRQARPVGYGNTSTPAPSPSQHSRYSTDEISTFSLRLTALLLFLLLLPVIFFWSIAFFVFALVPVITAFFLCWPVRLSRFWTLVLSVGGFIYGLALVIHMIVFLISPTHRAHFAVTWGVDGVDASGAKTRCTCGCSYPISNAIILGHVSIGSVAALRCLLIALRCLKGLRRANWANLLSVTYTVPVAVFDVVWYHEIDMPDGKKRNEPIKHRKYGESVQGELAFDPFALMDEQPGSAATTVELKPTPYEIKVVKNGKEETRLTSRPLRQPKAPRTQKDLVENYALERKEAVGCCGFPYRTGGMVGRISQIDDTDKMARRATRLIDATRGEVNEYSESEDEFESHSSGEFASGTESGAVPTAEQLAATAEAPVAPDLEHSRTSDDDVFALDAAEGPFLSDSSDVFQL